MVLRAGITRWFVDIVRAYVPRYTTWVCVLDNCYHTMLRYMSMYCSHAVRSCAQFASRTNDRSVVLREERKNRLIQFVQHQLGYN